MCGQDIFLAIFDKEKQKILEYRSDFKFNTDIVSGLLSKEIIVQF